LNNLSVIIICKDAAKHIEACFESIKWADEIIVLDSGSTDDTVAIAKRYTNNIHNTYWPGFGPQKNKALSYVTKPWVLSIDADEYLSPELQQAIQKITTTDCPENAFYIRRQSYYCGKLMRFGSWAKDDCLRLFKRESGKFSDDKIHERLMVTGKTSKIKDILYHEAYDNLEQVIEKMNSYSSLGAQMRLERGKKSSLSTALLHAMWSFIHGYIIRLGFLDGREGLLLAISNAEGCYYRYLKLMFLSEKLPPK
jgi:glycosyltransferase involved in cell wall biosynthesis